VVASYAGYLGESVLLWELWQRALAGQRDDGDLPVYHASDASLLALIDVGEASWRMPWTRGEAGARYLRETEANERVTHGGACGLMSGLRMNRNLSPKNNGKVALTRPSSDGWTVTRAACTWALTQAQAET